MTAFNEKQQVHDFWNQAACGETLYLKSTDIEGYEAQARKRYQLEPIILDFAAFESTKGMKVLEIGVGLGADHQEFAKAGAELYGIDLTERAIEHTLKRLDRFGLHSSLAVGDAENLSFDAETFDVVYSWGVLHHSPNTPAAISECWRVLKRGGVAKIMIYHKWSMVGLMLWLRYALFPGRPWSTLEKIYANYLESPGTKAYSISEAENLFRNFKSVKISTPLGHADLLESDVGQRHRGQALGLAKKVWPRWFIRKFFPWAGLMMLIEVKK